MSLRWPVIFSPLVLAACAESNDASRPMTSASRDSSGIRIVEHSSLEGLRTLDLEPAHLEIGGLQTDSNAEFDSRNPFLSAIRLTNGTIVAADFNRLKWFSTEGQFLKSVGGPGSGPGEFSQIREICRLAGDSVLAIDYSSGRLSVFDPDGRHVATHARAGFVPFEACGEDGTVIVQGSPANTNVDSATAYYSLRKLDGSLVADLGELPAPVYAPPFMLQPSFIVRRNAIYVGRSSTYTIDVLRKDGTPTKIVRVNIPLRPISDAELDKQFALMRPWSLADGDGGKTIARLKAIRRPSTYPAFGQVLVDGIGRIWVNSYDERREWIVFGETGAILGRLVLPQGSELAKLDSDRIVVRHRTGDGALQLTFHHLQPISSAAK